MQVAENKPGAGAVGASSQPYMRLVGNEEIDASRRPPDQPIFLTNLAAHMRRLWEDAKRAKQDVEREMLMDYRQRQGIYEPTKLNEIRKQGGSEIYIMLTSVKCNALEAWLSDVMLPADDRNWTAEPTPVSTIPPERKAEVVNKTMAMVQSAAMAMQPVDIQSVRAIAEQVQDEILSEVQKIASDAAERMEDQIDDDLTEGNFRAAMKDVISDMVTTKAGILMGPVYRRRKVLKWEQSPEGRTVPVETEEIRMEFMRRSPFDIYPSADATCTQDGYLFDKQQLAPSELLAMKGAPGYDANAIDAVVLEHRIGGYREVTGVEQQRREIEQKASDVGKSRLIDTLCYWGELQGSMLIEWAEGRETGIDLNKIDPTEEYAVNVWLCGRHVIGVMLNSTPLGRRPYHATSFRKIPGSWWGEGLPHEIRDAQDMCNAAGRQISNNMGLASGPQVVINDIDRVPINEDLTSLYPWKIWQFKSDRQATTHRPPLEFFQPSSMTTELMNVYERFSRIADEVSAVPAYTYGDTDLGGAGKTASGLSMLISQASKGIKHVIAGLDQHIIEPAVWMVFAYNMLYNPDETIKGDIEIKARGAVSLIAKEQQQVRRNEFLNATNNQLDAQIMGLPGRATLLREVAKSLEMPIDEVVPDPQNIESMAQQGQLQAMFMNIAQATGLSPEQVAQAAIQPPQQPPQQRSVDNAGNPVAGQDQRLFNA